MGGPGGPRTPEVRTERLVLVALTPDLARAADGLSSRGGGDREGFERLLGARVPKTWPGADFSRMLPRIAGGSEEGSAAGPTRLIVHAADNVLVGETGFHAPPDASGTVEVGYSVDPDYRGLGVATEATRALIDNALNGAHPGAEPGVRRVVAGCLAENPASRRVLEKLGMQRVGASGGVLRFELPL